MRPDARFVMFAPFPAIVILLIARLPVAWEPIHVVGLVLAVSGLALLTLARWQLGNAFSVAPRATTLVTHGLYARIRNPVYVFGLAMIAGLLLFVDQPRLLLLLLPVAILQVVRAGREARVLEERFGESYVAYRARTWF
jgi:protein-S-isoprenylcysteine O-methyltransferase Ste14